MRPGPVILWACTVITGAGVLAWSMDRAHAAHSEADIERAALRQTREQLKQLASMPSAIGSHASDDNRTLAARVASVLADSGLPRDRLDSLSPESQQPLSNNTTLARRRASLTLSPVTLPELGRFLDHWRQAERAWTVTAIDLNPQRQSASTVGGDLPLRVLITLETMSVREADHLSSRDSGRASTP